MGCASCNRSKGKCGTQYTNLRNFRNMLVKLYNSSSNVTKRNEYKDAIGQIDTFISQLGTKCITDQEFNLIKDYVNNEYK